MAPQRPASQAQQADWRGDRLQHAQACLPLGHGLGWLDAVQADPGAARPAPAPAAWVELPELTARVCAWRTLGPGTGQQAHVSAQGLAIHVAGAGPAAEAWLRSLAEGAAEAGDLGPTHSVMNAPTRATVHAVRRADGRVTHEQPPGRRLALLLGLSALQEPDVPLPDGTAAWPAPAAALPAGTCGAALRAACAVVEAEHLRRDVQVELNVHLHTAAPDWYATGVPDFLAAPPGSRGTCKARLLGSRANEPQPCAILYQQSGRSTPDSKEATLQLVAVAVAMELAREARRRCSSTIPPGLAAPLLVVGMPSDWLSVATDDPRLLARAWRFTFNPGGRVDVWRSARLTVGAATSQVLRHVAPS